MALAQHCEALGYQRFWVSEHHNHPTIVGTAPEIVIAAIAATTHRIRIGSAGIMLPHYAPFKVAEVFRVLDALAPGRIDLGLGRAPGSDGRTAFALNPAANERPEHFPADVRDLIAWVHNEPLVDRHPFAREGFPRTPRRIWILGSSDLGAQVAALFGRLLLPPGSSATACGERAIDLYKRSYRPSARHPPTSSSASGHYAATRRRRSTTHLARRRASAATAAQPGRWSPEKAAVLRSPPRPGSPSSAHHLCRHRSGGSRSRGQRRRRRDGHRHLTATRRCGGSYHAKRSIRPSEVLGYQVTVTERKTWGATGSTSRPKPSDGSALPA